GTGGEALSQQAFAFLGALCAVTIVFLLASARGKIEPITLLLVGVIVNAVNGSLFLLLNALTRDLPAAGGPLQFLVGGLQGTLTVQQEWTAVGLVVLGWAALMYLSGQLNAAG